MIHHITVRNEDSVRSGPFWSLNFNGDTLQKGNFYRGYFLGFVKIYEDNKLTELKNVHEDRKMGQRILSEWKRLNPDGSINFSKSCFYDLINHNENKVINVENNKVKLKLEKHCLQYSKVHKDVKDSLSVFLNKKKYEKLYSDDGNFEIKIDSLRADFTNLIVLTFHSSYRNQDGREFSNIHVKKLFVASN